MLLRNVRADDLDAYVAMRCDPVMMAELGGPFSLDGIEAKVQRDVAETAADMSWILMIQPDDGDPSTIAGSVVLWSQEDEGEAHSEIGWMVLPEFQGQGLAKAAVRLVLERGHEDGRWGPIHAFPGVTNGPSNGICRSLGFTLLGEEHILAMDDRPMTANHWVLHPSDDLPPDRAQSTGR